MTIIFQLDINANVNFVEMNQLNGPRIQQNVLVDKSHK